MKKILTICLGIILYGNSWGQGYDWVKEFDKSQYDNVNYIEKDQYGNIYLVGDFSDTIDFNLDTSQQYLLTPQNLGSAEIFIAKYDSNFSLIYVKTLVNNFGISLSDFAISSGGDILISGVFFGSIDLDPSVNDVIYANSSGMVAQSFILKLDFNGNYVFSHHYYDPLNTGENIVANCIFSNNGEVVLFASLSNCDIDITVNNQTIGGSTVIKYDANGSLLWHNIIGIDANYTQAYDVMENDINGNIYILGSFQNTIQFYNNTIPLTAKGSIDLLLFKLNTNGILEWYKELGGIGYETPYLLKYNSLRDEIIVSGESNDVFNFSPTSIHFPDNECNNGFIAGYDNLGNFLFNHEFPKIKDAVFDENGEIIVVGNFTQLTDFIGGAGTYLINPDSDDSFVAKLNHYGSLKWLSLITGKWSEEIKGIIYLNNKVYFTGTYSNTFLFDPNNPQDDLFSAQGLKIIIGSLLNNDKYDLIRGNIFTDYDQNCFQNQFEALKSSATLVVNPGNIIVDVSTIGFWSLDSLPSGTYTITYDTSGNWKATCPNPQTFTITNPDSITLVSPFGMINTKPCFDPDVSINMPFIRPCFTNQKIYVQACNTSLATGVLDSGYVLVELDSMLIATSSSIPYTMQGNEYRFDVGDLYPGQCVNYTIDATVSCDAILGQTLCMEANLYPIDSCALDSIPSISSGGVAPCTLPWDKSSLQVNGWCANDSVYFTITNTGDFGGGDMDCFSEVRIYLDGQYISLDSIMLVGGTTDTFVFAGNGQTWRLEADQHPLHPGNSHPNASVELCGNPSNWTPNLVNVLPHDDADPVKDVYCGVVTGSYDPNDKTGYPLGVTDTNFISPNQKLDYVIRFQNTGTDTAFTVAIRDTLDMDLNIFSVQEGVSSHNYNFRMYGPRILEWTFYNILLPDSTTDLEGSNGFVTFTVEQVKDLANGTEITNSAGIYFDFNVPIITNTSKHVINDGIQTNVLTKLPELREFKEQLRVYPNPFTETFTVKLPLLQETNQSVRMVDVVGKEVNMFTINSSRKDELIIDASNLTKGVYFIELSNGNEIIGRTKVVKN